MLYPRRLFTYRSRTCHADRDVNDIFFHNILELEWESWAIDSQGPLIRTFNYILESKVYKPLTSPLLSDIFFGIHLERIKFIQNGQFLVSLHAYVNNDIILIYYMKSISNRIVLDWWLKLIRSLDHH